MKFVFPVMLALAGAAAFTLSKIDFHDKNTVSRRGTGNKSFPIKDNAELMRLKTYSSNLKPYLSDNGFNTDVAFLVDMKIASRKKRFFVYSLSGDSVLTSGLVTHGSGSQTATAALKFSNIPNSYATSLGRYKISNAYTGKFGLAYKLIGLDKSNSNAYTRAVVLHAHPLIPAQETNPEPICTSWGCPTVNQDFLKLLAGVIDASEKPVMLLFFY